MVTVESIVSLIDQLPAEDRRALVKRLADENWAAWDKQIEDDAASGRLDGLLKKVNEEIDAGGHRPL